VASLYEAILQPPGPVYALGFALGIAAGVLPIAAVHAVG
jgi:hypothetical protein